jgi:hypothetical protein
MISFWDSSGTNFLAQPFVQSQRQISSNFGHLYMHVFSFIWVLLALGRVLLASSECFCWVPWSIRMLQNWSDPVNDPVLVKFYLGSVIVEHSIQQALYEKIQKQNRHNESRNNEKCPNHLFCHKMFHVTGISIHTRNSTAKACIHVNIFICTSWTKYRRHLTSKDQNCKMSNTDNSITS